MWWLLLALEPGLEYVMCVVTMTMAPPAAEHCTYVVRWGPLHCMQHCRESRESRDHCGLDRYNSAGEISIILLGIAFRFAFWGMQKWEDFIHQHDGNISCWSCLLAAVREECWSCNWFPAQTWRYSTSHTVVTHLRRTRRLHAVRGRWVELQTRVHDDSTIIENDVLAENAN